MTYKICSKCGAQCPETVKFCSICGSNEFVQSEPPEFEVCQDNGKKEKKPLKWWQIILIVIGCLAVIGLVKEAISPSGTDSSTASDTGRSEASVPYTKGTTADGYYINEWANIKFPADGAYPNAEADTYELAEEDLQDAQDVGYISLDFVTGDSFVLEIDDVSSASKFALTDSAIRKTMVSQYGGTLEESGVDAEFGEVTSTLIAGESYAHISAGGENSYGVTVYIDVFWRVFDGHVIILAMTGTSPTAACDFAAEIAPVN